MSGTKIQIQMIKVSFLNLYLQYDIDDYSFKSIMKIFNDIHVTLFLIMNK